MYLGGWRSWERWSWVPWSLLTAGAFAACLAACLAGGAEVANVSEAACVCVWIAAYAGAVALGSGAYLAAWYYRLCEWTRTTRDGHADYGDYLTRMCAPREDD